jgi:hypothetical protein
MFVQNDKYPNLVYVRAVKPLDGLRVRVVFTDDSTRDIDLDPYLQGPLFEPIRRSRTLFASVYVDPDTETLTWPNGADIDPDVLYYDGNPPWVMEETPSPN